ncbi:MAG: tail fiber domain-containing protein, partial [Thermoflexales bacterium]|nr:tail fiber domain-containing protein [Thermoflexales bacterium]
TVGGGSSNQANGDWSFVGGGSLNIANGANASISGGNVNFASGDYTSIMGGSNNTASGYVATVAGGLSNTAQGSGSFAAGTRAKANHNGTFVWGDSSPFNDVASTAANQFVARASGGVTFFTSFDLSTGVTAPAGGGSFSSVSDRNVKANFAAIDPRTVLERLAQVPISTWNYKTQDAAIRHIGPMAQDFAAAFAVGEDDTHISTIDADGVSLAAIQGLYQIAQEKDVQIAQLQARLDALEHRANPIDPVTANGLIGFITGAVMCGVAFWLGARRAQGGVR